MLCCILVHAAANLLFCYRILCCDTLHYTLYSQASLVAAPPRAAPLPQASEERGPAEKLILFHEVGFAVSFRRCWACLHLSLGIANELQARTLNDCELAWLHKAVRLAVPRGPLLNAFCVFCAGSSFMQGTSWLEGCSSCQYPFKSIEFDLSEQHPSYHPIFPS